jgi:hypothetical protein
VTAALTGAGATAPAWSTAWADALAELEMGVDEAEALLAAAHRTDGMDGADAVGRMTLRGGWVPPSHLGLLPASLAERATALLDRQLRVAQQLAEAASHSRRQLRAVESMRAAEESRPVYLDTAG